jgi:DNA modification methylase
MRKPFWSDTTARLYVGDACEVLAEMPAGSADCIVTSPPYWGKRDYGIVGQYGLEENPSRYLATLREVFRHVYRVLAADGTCWINIGDSYATGSKGSGGTAASTLTGRPSPGVHFPVRAVQPELPAKNLLGLPWRLAWLLQHDGWILRNAIVWHKPNAMPESVQDRLSCRYELIFLLVKQPRYWFDLDAIREPLKCPDAAVNPPAVGGRRGPAGCTGASARRRPGRPHEDAKYHPAALAFNRKRHGAAMLATGRRHAAAHPGGKNPGDVWPVTTRRYSGAHFAVFPADIPLRCIAAGCRPGGTVGDPFAGTATTGIAARHLHRQFWGIEISPRYAGLAKDRLSPRDGGPQ